MDPAHESRSTILDCATLSVICDCAVPSTGGLRQAVHLLRELDVALGHPTGIMRRKSDLHLVVDIEPFRMVVELFGDERRACHEAEGLVEILEREFSADGVATIDLDPALELGEGRFASSA